MPTEYGVYGFLEWSKWHELIYLQNIPYEAFVNLYKLKKGYKIVGLAGSYYQDNNFFESLSLEDFNNEYDRRTLLRPQLYNC